MKVKITKTALWCMLITIVVCMAVRYYIGLSIMDDDIMMVNALSLMVITCLTVMILIAGVAISSIWQEKKNNSKKTRSK